MLRELALVAATILVVGCGATTSDGGDEAGGTARAAGDAMQLAGAAASGDQTPPEGLTWIAVRDINRVYDDDTNPTNRPPLIDEAPEGMIRPVDVSPDGQADWLMDYTEAGSTQWCGTGGCRFRLFVSTPDGLVQVFDANADDVEVLGEGRLRVRAHRMYCDDQADADACVIDLAYDAAGRRLAVASGSDDFNPLGWTNSEQ